MTFEPRGSARKFRVVGVDLFSHEDYLVQECAEREEAFRIADAHNSERTGSMEDVYYVYDDHGTYIRGNEAVNQKVSP